MDVENALPPPADPVTPATSPSKRAAAAGDLYPWVGPSQAEIERIAEVEGSYVPTPPWVKAAWHHAFPNPGDIRRYEQDIQDRAFAENRFDYVMNRTTDESWLPEHLRSWVSSTRPLGEW